MDNLLKCLKEYFLVLGTHYAKFQQSILKAQRPLVALSNQSEQLRMSKGYNDEENVDLPDLKNKLLAKIIYGIEDEISSLKEIVAECLSSNLHLKRKFIAVENAGIADENMYKGDSTCPSPSLMVEWSGDAWRLFHVLYIQMHHSLNELRYEDEKSVRALKKAFSIDDPTKRHISWMLACTSIFVQS